MLRRTAAALQVDATRLFSQMNPTPLRGWKAIYAEKINPDNHELRKQIRHKQKEEEFGPGYDQLNADNFPYMAVMSLTFTFFFGYLAVGPGNIGFGRERNNDPGWKFNPKNADGSTQMPELPRHPSPHFAESVMIRE
eukprot:TRINITY_DN20_c1_g1_i1.p1 TRINITY_DN20_c1_g1~~TRINITY_DN20_c1_g1_i1.p1  ORF type:complete len:137 (+),score=18.18 TRINITY_DN20_c1_g1_i1:49-459(+)